MRRFHWSAAALIAVVTAAGCSDQNVLAPGALAPSGPNYSAAAAGSSVYIVAGNGQTGQAGAVVGPRDPAFQVRKSDGTAAVNVDVTFTCSGDCKLSNPATVTDANGVAATRWQLPTTNGTATLTASVLGDGKASIVAFVGGAVEPVTITQIAGNGQTANAGSNVPVSPTVRAFDAGGIPLPGAVLTFVPSGNGQVSSQSVTTDANGYASAEWRLSTNNSSPQLQVCGNGSSVCAPLFTATANPVASKLVITSDTRRNCGSSCVTYGFAGPGDPTVRLLDNLGNGVDGVTVSFAPSGGVVSNPTVVTSGGGYASTRWQFGKTPGTYTLTASVPSNPSVFNAVFTADVVPSAGTQIIKATLDNQRATAGQLYSPTPYVRVLDAANRPIVGAVVTFTPSRNGQVSNPTAFTDSLGYASTEWQLSTTPPFQLSACINGEAAFAATANCTVFTANATAIPATMQIVAGNGQTGAAGTVLPIGPAVSVLDADGQPINGITVVFSGPGTFSNPRAVTGANGQPNGVAQTLYQLPSTPGSYVITATVTKPDGTTLTRTFTEIAQ